MPVVRPGAGQPVAPAPPPWLSNWRGRLGGCGRRPHRADPRAVPRGWPRAQTMHDHCQRCGGCVFVCARRADIQLLAQGVSLLLEVDDLLSYDDGTLLKGGVEFLVLLVGLVYEALVFLVSLGNLDLGMLCATVVCCTCATSCTPPPSRDTSSALAPVRYFLLAGQHSVISNHQILQTCRWRHEPRARGRDWAVWHSLDPL